jgi:putative transposase
MSTRQVDDLVWMLGADSGISKSEVNRICADLDAEVGTFRTLNSTDVERLVKAMFCLVDGVIRHR